MGKKGRIYLTGGQYLSLKELSKLVNSDKIPPSIPVDFLILILPLINLYDKLFKLKWPVSRESLYTLKFSPKKWTLLEPSKNYCINRDPLKIPLKT